MTRVWAACTVALLALVAAGCGSSKSAPQTIPQAFAQLLATRYPGLSGPSRCPDVAREAEPQPCIAELHRGDRYVQVWAFPSRAMPLTFHHVTGTAWTRKWSGYGRAQFVSQGLISVNSQGYDWRWLVLGADALCRQKHRTVCTAPGIDSSVGGYPVFDDFRCHAQKRFVWCRNALGDALRWRPNA